MNIRQAEISKLLGAQQQVGVHELAKCFGVSQMTIRRDLTFLESVGLAVRTHGGAVVAGKLRFMQSGFPEQESSTMKKEIGKLAATLVKQGEIVMIDDGRTTFEVAMQLPRNIDITLATNSLRIPQALYGSSMKVLLLGGFLRKDHPSLYGPLAEHSLISLRPDIVFIGCDGVDSKDGFYMADLQVASLEQAMVEVAQRVVIVMESFKFGRRSFARFAMPQQVYCVVTDSGISEQDRSNLEARGIKVLMVDKNKENED